MAGAGRAVGVLEIENHVVGVERVRAKGQILIPRQHAPFAGAFRVAIEKVVLVARVDVLRDRDGRQEVDHARHVNVVEDVAIERGAREAKADQEGLQVGVAFRDAGLLFERRHGVVGGTRPAFIEGTVFVQPDASEEILVRLLGVNGDAVERAVLAKVREAANRGGQPDVALVFVGEHGADVGLVGVGRVQVEFRHARLARLQFEFMVLIELNFVALLRPGDRGAAADAHEHVVVELAIVEERAAGAGRRLGLSRRGDEPVEDGQRRVDGRVRNDGSEVLIGVERVVEQRRAAGPPECVGGRDGVANHLAVGRSTGGNRCAENSVACGSVSVCAVVEHRHGDFVGIHDAVAECDVGHGREGGRDASGDDEILGVGRHGGRVIGLADDRSQHVNAGQVIAAGSRRREIDERVGDGHGG